MVPFFSKVNDLHADADLLKRRRYGVIEMVDERLLAVHLRPWPKVISLPEIWWWGQRCHRRAAGNRCLLYYNQPVRFSNFLALTYLVSNQGTTVKTLRNGLEVLDEIARIKHTDAILCEVSNLRISNRLLNRLGWERHVRGSRRRHYIKRF